MNGRLQKRSPSRAKRSVKSTSKKVAKTAKRAIKTKITPKMTTSSLPSLSLPSILPSQSLPKLSPFTPSAKKFATKGSFEHHIGEASKHNFEVGSHRPLTNVIRGSWNQSPIMNYNIVSHLEREPEEVDELVDGSKMLVEPSQFTPVDWKHVPSIDELTSQRSDKYLHHNELLRMKGAFAAVPAVGEAQKDPTDRWFDELSNYVWHPVVQSYQTMPSRARLRLIDENGLSHGKGGRKSSSAWATLKPGTGLMFVNGRPYHEYFPSTEHRSQLGMPFYMTGTVAQFDVFLKVKGGGVTGQADAAKLAIANALQNFEPQFRPTLKVNALLKRDSRAVERKHAGRKKARKSFTWVKR
jgi:small subunit ribosomal protein S9